MSIQSSLISMGTSVFDATASAVSDQQEEKEKLQQEYEKAVNAAVKAQKESEKRQVKEKKEAEKRQKERKPAPDNSMVTENATHQQTIAAINNAFDALDAKKTQQRLGRNPNAYFKSVYGNGGRY